MLPTMFIAGKLFGGAGNNVLIGGTGSDTMTGGIGDDMSVFNALNGSGVGIGNSDLITDFEGAGLVGGDTIALSALDANAWTAGDQGLSVHRHGRLQCGGPGALFPGRRRNHYPSQHH